MASLSNAINLSISRLKTQGKMADPGHWQGIPTLGKPDLQTKEIVNLTWSVPMPLDRAALTLATRPNLPWAELEFKERVSGRPQNPHESLKHWPWWRSQTDETMVEGKFTHTYSERFWPQGIPGVRFRAGDLNDLLELLGEHPYTRQATLPIFFPEDTGATHGGRIPCTLHYHFMLRHNELHLWYPIRSCDAVRHFRDDIYMACRLVQWVIAQMMHRDQKRELWPDVIPGELHFTAYSFHVHMGDYHLL